MQKARKWGIDFRVTDAGKCVQVVTLVCLVFSVVYILWHRSTKLVHRAPGNSAIAVLGQEMIILEVLRREIQGLKV